MKGFQALLLSLLAFSLSAVPAYAAIDALSTSSFAQSAPSCTTNAECSGGSSVCSDVHYTDTNANVKKCTSCGGTGAASCTAPTVCQAGSCVAPTSSGSVTNNGTSVTNNGNSVTNNGNSVTNSGNSVTNTGGETSLHNPLNNVSSLQDLLTAILGGVVLLGSIALVVALVWVGALFVFAQGQEEKIRDARNALMWTVIGGLVLLGAESISLVIQHTAEGLS